MRTSRIARAIGAIVVGASVFATACGGGDATPRVGEGVSTDQADIDAALAFSGVRLPPGAKVLGVLHAAALDETYELSLTTPPGELPELLAESKVSAEFVPGDPGYKNVIAGPEPAKVPLVETADDDEYVNPDGEVVDRTITVDKRDPALFYVHVLAASD